MRLRHPLLMLSLITLLAPGAALASVRASGLLCTASGAASVSSSSDGRRLTVSGIGSSGQDGVDVSLSRVDGHHLSSSSSWSDSDNDAVCRWSFGASNPTSLGSSGLSHGRVMIHKLHNGQRVTLDLSEFSSTSSMTLYLYLDGALVSSVSCPSSTTFDLSSVSSTLPIPDVGMEFARSSSPKRQCLFNIGLKGRMSFFQNGSIPTQCDRIIGVEECDDGNDFALDGCSVRVSCPVGSSLSSLDFDSQSVVRFGVSLSVADLDCDGGDDEFSMTSSGNPLYTSSTMSGTNPLFDQVFGHGGGGGGGGGALSSLDSSLQPFSLQFSRTSPPFFQPSVDAGASLECRVVGTGTCSPTGEVASLRSLYLASNQLQVSSSFAGMCADQESVYVSKDGLLVASFAMPPSHSVLVSPPPGGPLGMAINEKGLPGEKKPNSTKTNNPKRSTPVGGESSASVVGADGLSLHVSFLDKRVVCVDGTCVTGDDITFHGQCSSGACSASGTVITITGQDFSLQRCSSGACSPSSSSLHVSNSVASGVDQVRASLPPSVSLSSSSLVAMVPVVIDRASSSSSRGTSVTFHLSSNLVLASSVVEYDYFSLFGSSQMFVVDNGGGSYTVDCALLGPGCGPSSSGTLFAIPVSRAPGAPDGVGSVTIDACEVADCNAGPIPARSGGAVYIVLDSSAPSPPTIVATQVKTGNDGSGLTRTSFQLGSLAVEDAIELYRASFGNYPLYEDGPSPGSVPVVSSSSPPAAPWEPVQLSIESGGTGTSQLLVAFASKRGYDYYMARSVDRAGNVSSSVMSNGVLTYHLGDVAGGPPCGGDNQVTTADISRLGAAYGSTFATSSSLTCLDIGPTVDGTIDGRPSPDQRLSFRDLILYAINYSLVSMPASRPQAAATNALRLGSYALPAPGQTFDVALEMDGAGDVQGLSTQLAWDPAVVEPIGVSQGALMDQQGRLGMVLSPDAGVIDAAVFGVGGGIAGSGPLARVTFRMRTAGDPAIRIANVDARDAQNQPLILGTTGTENGYNGRTALRMAFPNPFDRNLTIALALAQRGPAEVGVFDVAGRKVRTLVSGIQPAGQRLVTWDGRDDSGTRLGAGVYMLRLDAGGHSETRAVRLVK